MTNLKPMETLEISDAELVAQSLAGNREAFGRIVSRYQSLICSLNFSATGNLSQSEDLAQETFIAAWKELAKLREPAKLRAWLCQISRYKAFDALRRQGREPSHAAESLDLAQESLAPEPAPAERAISREEQEILWRSIERIPEVYREPLVLFYREHQSIESVALSLELSEDAVKQRLSRGRKLLQEQVLAFVEGALERTNPGKAFTLGVLASLPALTMSTKAATLGASAAKGSATAKAAGLMGLFSAILAPVLVFLGNYVSYRMCVDEARSDEERGRIKAIFRKALVWTLGLAVLLAVPLHWFCRSFPNPSLFWALFINCSMILYFFSILVLVLTSLPMRRRYLSTVLARDHGGQFPAAAWEYRSRLSLLGLPLVHVRIGDRFDVLRGPVKAWVAVGSSHAVGVIFASGGLAVAPLSLGGLSIGLLPFGAIAMGAFPVGAFALGLFAYGGLALGWQAFGACAVGWQAAMGGVAVAHEFAIGGVTQAALANTELARQFVQANWFFQCAQKLAGMGLLVTILWVLPLALQGRLVARARRRHEQQNSVVFHK